MGKRLFIQEAAKLAPKKSDGTYRVVLITEGEGSTGRYSADLINRSAHVFENAPSFLNHPIDPAKPHLRPVESIAGRFKNVEAEDGPHGRQLAADYKPRSGEVGEFVEEFSDLVGLSIFCGADGEVLEDGRLDVQELDAEDPYRSVDIVVAAGRGGRFKRAEESARTIESSLGKPQGPKPAAEASAEEKEREHMEEVLKAIEALTESLKPVVAFVNESAKKADESKPEVDAEALDSARAEGAKAAAESLKAIDDAKLPEKIAEAFKAKVLAGEDVTEAVASAKTIADAVIESAVEDGETKVHVIESAERGSGKKDWSY